MTTTVCLTAETLDYPAGGGHLWAYLNWALGLRAAGCEVIWLEHAGDPPGRGLRARLTSLKTALEPYGLAKSVALYSPAPIPRVNALDLEAAGSADLLIDLTYGLPHEVMAQFERTALIDIDPGMTQSWMSDGNLTIPPHDVYFTIGENVGASGTRVPDCGLHWHYTPPCVAIEWWPVRKARLSASYTTVSHWWGEELELGGELIPESKREGFLDYLDLPSRTGVPLELALGGISEDEDEDEYRALKERGWKVSEAWEVASTAARYRSYVQRSRGEFSCAKPPYVRLQTGWLSDRTACYLASGKPAIVQDTGPSRFLPAAEGLFRFRNPDEAVRALRAAEDDYEHHCRRARELAEEHFDAKRVLTSILERALASGGPPRPRSNHPPRRAL